MIAIQLEDSTPIQLGLFHKSTRLLWIELADRFRKDCGRPWRAIRKAMRRSLDGEEFPFELPDMDIEHLEYFIWQLIKMDVLIGLTKIETQAKPSDAVPIEALRDALESSCSKRLLQLSPESVYFLGYYRQGTQPDKPKEWVN